MDTECSHSTQTWFSYHPATLLYGYPTAWLQPLALDVHKEVFSLASANNFQNHIWTEVC